MTEYSELRSITPAIDIYIKLAQFPVLADVIRVRMREELFRRGIVSQAQFEAEIKASAIESQQREGLLAPFTQEEESIWEKRKERVRAYQTDAYYANNLGSAALDQLIAEVLRQSHAQIESIELTFNPELAPWELLFRQGEIYEAMPEWQREDVQHHLQEIKVVLIKRMISEQLPFIGAAKRVLSIQDLRRIYRRRIGGGKIGGKAAGMILAWKILQQQDPEYGPDLSRQVAIPDSYFIGSEVIYEFSVINRFDDYLNQKYRSIEEIRQEYPNIVEDYLQGRFSESIVDRLREMLSKYGNQPLIVRSSSLLEDNFGFSFADKYDSFFCPNQGTEQQNLRDLLDAIRRVYASLLNPEALLYRREHDLLDYDERMAVMIQPVHGYRHGRYFMPAAAGVAYSQNPFRWHANIRREDGFLRLVWGLGTRAVDRMANDYPRLVALSHPQLRPDPSPEARRLYSQVQVDVLDLNDNRLKSLPVSEVLDDEYPLLDLIASADIKESFLENATESQIHDHDYLITFDGLTRDSRFVKLMRTALLRLEQAYRQAVDLEFAVEIEAGAGHYDYCLHILQCRPLTQRLENIDVTLPANIPEEDVLFDSNWIVPDGKVENIRYIVYVDPDRYRQVDSDEARREIGRAISRLNEQLGDERFIIVGPGRWGTPDPSAGVQVTYSDIYNARLLVEIGSNEEGKGPELSHGTHFFQDLVESNVQCLSIWPEDNKGSFERDFLVAAPCSLSQLSPPDTALSPNLHVIDVPAVTGGRYLHFFMNGNQDRAVGFVGEEI